MDILAVAACLTAFLVFSNKIINVYASGQKYYQFFGVHHPFSLNYICEFSDIQDHRFQSLLQYIIYQKAVHVRDIVKSHKILTTTDPAELHKINSTINSLHIGFGEKWYDYLRAITDEGNYLKFTKNKWLKRILIGSLPKYLYYADRDDQTWSIGVDIDSPLRFSPGYYDGRNILGKSLTSLAHLFKYDRKLI